MRTSVLKRDMIPIVEGNDFLLRTHVNVKEEGQWVAFDLARATNVKAYLVRDDRPSERIPLQIDGIAGDFVRTPVDGSRVRAGKHGVEVTFLKQDGNKGRVFRRSLVNVVHCNDEAIPQEEEADRDVYIYVNLDVESIDIGKDTVDQALREQVARNTEDIAKKANADSVDEDLTNLEVLELLGLN